MNFFLLTISVTFALHKTTNCSPESRIASRLHLIIFLDTIKSFPYLAPRERAFPKSD